MSDDQGLGGEDVTQHLVLHNAEFTSQRVEAPDGSTVDTDLTLELDVEHCESKQSWRMAIHLPNPKTLTNLIRLLRTVARNSDIEE